MQLPRHRVATERGFLQCSLDSAMIDMFVTNTNLYTTAHQVVHFDPNNLGGDVALPGKVH